MDTIPDQLRANLLRAQTLTAGLTDQQFNWRPEPGRWSVAECLAHLNTTNQLDVEPLRLAITEGRRRGIKGGPPFRYGWLSRKFISMLEPPVTTKMKAPAAYAPPSEARLAPTLGSYEKLVQTFADLYDSATGLDLARIKTTFPALPSALQPLLRMPVGARFEALAAHDRRHLWQAEQVLRKLKDGS